MARAGKIFACIVALATVGICYSTAAKAETYYRWIDDRGNPVHSDRPPPKGINYEVVSTTSSLVRQVEPEVGAVPKKVQPTVSNNFEPVETRQVMVEKNPEYCARAKQNLATLNGPARIRLRNDQGEYRYIDEEEKEVQRQQARDTIAVHCE